jgi:hypothetical protein
MSVSQDQYRKARKVKEKKREKSAERAPATIKNSLGGKKLG